MITVITDEWTYLIVPMWNFIARNTLLSIGMALMMFNVYGHIIDKIKRVLK